MVSGTINSSLDIAPSRHHTIALTELRDPDVLLPGDQPQVIVLETADTTDIVGNTTSGIAANTTTILIRGADYNATSVERVITCANLYIQPIDQVRRYFAKASDDLIKIQILAAVCPRIKHIPG